jgi:hypothetical protein
LAILAVAVVQFLVGHGRVWNKPFDWDRSILWSYATIALLVLDATRRTLEPTLLSEASLGEIAGRVIDPDGKPVQGALVFISEGLNHLVFAAPNVPLLASGQIRTLRFEEAKGLVTVHCTVHQSREGEARLAILNHPFFVISGADGGFALPGVPSGNLTVSGIHPAWGESSTAVRLTGGEKVGLALSLGHR